MKKFLIGLSILGLTNLAYPNGLEGGKEIPSKDNLHTPPATNKNYQKLARQGSSARRVHDLQKMAAEFDPKESTLFEPGAQTYGITFQTDKERIQATYDSEGNIRHTLEKYDNVSLPSPVRNSIWRDYHGCTIEKNSYQIYYSDGKITKAIYKVWIEMDGHQKRLKLDAAGRFV